MKLLRSTVVATAATLVVLAPTAAHATTVSHYDTTGDVVAITFDEADNETLTPVPDRKQGDISKVRTSFEGETIRISASFRGLVKAGPFMFHSIPVVTTKLRRQIDIFAGQGSWAGEVQMSKYDRPVTCKGLTHKIDYTAKVVVVTFPRNCLAVNGVKPGAIRVGWGTGTFGNDETIYVDDAFHSGPITEDAPLTLSAKVFR